MLQVALLQLREVTDKHVNLLQIWNCVLILIARQDIFARF